MLRYINGNYLVTLNDYDGTKEYRCFRFDEEFSPEFPDSIDLKITNRCSNNCPWCHESSVSEGKDFDPHKTKEVLSVLPKVGIELAIGGGNILEIDLDLLLDFLKWLKEQNFKSRITINHRDFNYPERIEKLNQILWNSYWSRGKSLVSFVGISIDRLYDIEKTNDIVTNSIKVYHIIVGIFPIHELKDLLSREIKILILGYKSCGFGKNYNPSDIDLWRDELKKTIFSSGLLVCKLGFDNLAIEQLNIKEFLLSTEWDNSYMGQEFSHSMYIDAVGEQYAPTSRDLRRTDWKDADILSYFQSNKNSHND